MTYKPVGTGALDCPKTRDVCYQNVVPLSFMIPPVRSRTAEDVGPYRFAGYFSSGTSILTYRQIPN